MRTSFKKTSMLLRTENSQQMSDEQTNYITPQNRVTICVMWCQLPLLLWRQNMKHRNTSCLRSIQHRLALCLCTSSWKWISMIRQLIRCIANLTIGESLLSPKHVSNSVSVIHVHMHTSSHVSELKKNMPVLLYTTSPLQYSCTFSQLVVSNDHIVQWCWPTSPCI